MVQGKDHNAHLVLSRDDLEEDLVYRYVGVERVVPYLQEGDKIRLQRVGKSYSQIYLTVVENHSDYVVAEKETGKRFELWSRYTVNLESSPWLRYNGKSAGEVKSLTIKELY